ncbi:hypothetical protein ZIOFF_074978 [Zingiber officinale]|uniref:Coiled-coil domain-containing protein 130 n=1 Tax=Zingiber officinale TaxID=94328 RepID=A0A8J5C1Y3_ZINOF|nr:hypothetical protein ZIOFF_074978 [Zingiber officinale]
MSSLAAARADNFYYPPEWDPKKGSLNKFQGQHPLRERARKLDQGILIIRFEMPFNIWCGGCNHMIAKGVRFNAEKKQVGNYYSTKIWSFTMKSACCRHEIVIQTDPKNTEYVIISGAQRKTEDYDIEDAETFALPADEERGKLSDPFYRLEHQEEDMRKKKEAEPLLVRLQRVSDSRHAEDYSLNRALRARLRVICCLIIIIFSLIFFYFVLYMSTAQLPSCIVLQFQTQKRKVVEEEETSRKMGLGIRLLPPSKEDAASAAAVRFAPKFDKNSKDKRAAIKASSIFSESSTATLGNKRAELEAKRRKIKATAASSLLAGRVKPLSWQQDMGFRKR